MMSRALLLVVLAGCALTRNAPPRDIHYFAPAPRTAVPAEPANRAMPARPRLRLGRITHADHLRYRIVQRTSPVEVAPYETRRWTERPAEYVRRALALALFEERGLAQTLGGAGPALDVEVIAFEEVMTPRHVGRVHLGYRLQDGRTVVASGELTAEADVTGHGFEAVVVAIGNAMTQAVARVADVVEAELARGPR